MGILPQEVVGVLPRGYIFFFLNIYTNSNTYQQNEIDIKSSKTKLSDVKSWQIPVSVTEKQSNYFTRITLKLHENGYKFSQTWLIGFLARYSSFQNTY